MEFGVLDPREFKSAASSVVDGCLAHAAARRLGGRRLTGHWSECFGRMPIWALGANNRQRAV